MAFTDIELEWGAKVYTIKSNRVMKAIAIIEDNVTFPELENFRKRGTMPLSRVSSAFAGVLRYAGARVTDEDVYEALFTGEDAAVAMQESITKLMMMMLPASARAKLAASPEEASEDDAGNSRATTTEPASSKKPSSSVVGRKTRAALA